jgi:hypothetical protein
MLVKHQKKCKVAMLEKQKRILKKRGNERNEQSEQMRICERVSVENGEQRTT